MMPTALSLMALAICVAAVCAGQDADERVIRDMVDQAIARLNKGDATAFGDYWDEDADYVSVGGALITGRKSIQEFFEKSVKPAEELPPIKGRGMEVV